MGQLDKTPNVRYHRAWTMAVYDGKLFCGTLPSGHILSLEAGMLPPNLNLERPDPECGIHLVGEKGLAINAELAMKTSFGFGGGNGVLIFRRSVNGAGA